MEQIARPVERCYVEDGAGRYSKWEEAWASVLGESDAETGAESTVGRGVSRRGKQDAISYGDEYVATRAMAEAVSPSLQVPACR